MGLAEQIIAGASLTRDTITVPVTAIGSASFGSAYALLSIAADKPCRVRLYDNESGWADEDEAERPFGSTNISASVALVGDFIISSSGRQFVDPVVYSVAESYEDPYTYYRIDDYDGFFPDQQTPVATLTITRYLLEDNTLDNTSGRKTFSPGSYELEASGMVSGTIGTSPRTFLLVSASVASTTAPARIRLYSKLAAINNSNEKNRTFDQPASASAFLIVDAILTGSEVTHFSPKIIGANLNTMGTDLSITRRSNALIAGDSEIYYVLENLGATTETINVSIHTYSLED
jgi:hypothetical protein